MTPLAHRAPAPRARAGTLAGLGVVAGLLVGTASAWAAPVSPCPDARYLIPLEDEPLIVGAHVVPDAVVVVGREVSITSGCRAAPAKKMKGTRRGTLVAASWRMCGDTRRVRLTATIVDDCRVMTGIRRARGAQPRHFTAFISVCGDGIVDAARHEDCDGAPCADGRACTDCSCPPPPPPSSTTSTTTTTTTSSTATVTTVPDSCAELCGDDFIDEECFEQCDGDDLGDAVCPGDSSDGALLDCPQCTDACRLDFSCCPTTTVTTSTSSSSSTSSSTSSTSSSTTLPVVRFATQVAPILTGSCLGLFCHTSQFLAGGLDLSTTAKAYAGLVNALSTECGGAKRVVPGTPSASYLMSKIAAAGPCLPTTPMPLGRPALPAGDITRIRTWILQGAPNN